MSILAIGAADSSGLSGLWMYAHSAECDCRIFPVTACVIARSRDGRVKAVSATPPTIIARQIDAATEIEHPQACIVGMLARHQAVHRVAERIQRREICNIVLAPVLGREDGRDLMTAQGIKQTRRQLVPLADIIVGDAQTLQSLANSERGVAAAAQALRDNGAKSVIALWQQADKFVCRVFAGQTAQFSLGPGSQMDQTLIDRLAVASALSLTEGKSLTERLSQWSAGC
ncbi:MAG: bifunctional hydroxymethylpyrimidine kinase/phosphomethylpyrimidine kinase [Armatimonadetes bacterium]|nr:bifunctional hydroxymethylpyrimidine kinase/phosphomethylpyrimidine kinase [Armatimonadota bacterium]